MTHSNESVQRIPRQRFSNSLDEERFLNLNLSVFRLDGKHVVFGMVTDGMDVVKQMESYGTQSGSTRKRITIADCGQVSA